jgi:hypothetical protein
MMIIGTLSKNHVRAAPSYAPHPFWGKKAAGHMPENMVFARPSCPQHKIPSLQTLYFIHISKACWTADSSMHQIMLSKFLLIKIYHNLSHCYKCIYFFKAACNVNAKDIHCLPKVKTVKQRVTKSVGQSHDPIAIPRLIQKNLNGVSTDIVKGEFLRNVNLNKAVCPRMTYIINQLIINVKKYTYRAMLIVLIIDMPIMGYFHIIPECLSFLHSQFSTRAPGHP